MACLGGVLHDDFPLVAFWLGHVGTYQGRGKIHTERPGEDGLGSVQR